MTETPPGGRIFCRRTEEEQEKKSPMLSTNPLFRAVVICSAKKEPHHQRLFFSMAVTRQGFYATKWTNTLVRKKLRKGKVISKHQCCKRASNEQQSQQQQQNLLPVGETFILTTLTCPCRVKKEHRQRH